MSDLTLHWQPVTALPENNLLFQWLAHGGSFIERLQQLSVGTPRVEVLREAYDFPEPWEASQLGISTDEKIFVREVSIHSNQCICLFARTLMPSAILEIKNELIQLGNRSLGSILFQDATMKRNKMECIYARPKDLWKNFLVDHDEYWMRRSLFYLSKAPLLLTEIFQPSLGDLCKRE